MEVRVGTRDDTKTAPDEASVSDRGQYAIVFALIAVARGQPKWGDDLQIRTEEARTIYTLPR